MRKWLRSRPASLGRFLARTVTLMGKTFRMQEVNPPSKELLSEGAIISGWHGRSLPAAVLYRGRSYWVMVSHSRDGEIQANVFGTLGFQVIRGSTKRGGAQAAVEGIRALKGKGVMALTPDGPRGPSGVVQGGMMLMAQKSGAPVIPIGIAARPRLLVRSWDKYMVPWLFARCVFVYGDPIYVPKDADEQVVEGLRLLIQEQMHALENEAEERLGNPALSHTERHG